MPAADLILTNANVITMDARRPAAASVAVKGGRILAVSGENEPEDLRGPGTKIIDCGGRTVLPGFNDAHCHLFAFIHKLLSLDLSPAAVGSIEDIKAALKKRAEETPPGTWIRGTDYNEFYLAEKRHPTRRDLDEVTPRHPVVLTQRSMHICVFNSLALQLGGIDTTTPEPPGTMIDREPTTGEPNGILYEMLNYVRGNILPPLSEEALERGAAMAGEYYLAHGITSFQDVSTANSPERWRIYRGWQDSNRLRSRMMMMFGPDNMELIREAGMKPHFGDNRLRLGGVKFILTETTGRLQPPPAELNEKALAAHRAGFQLAFHAVEPGTVEAAVTAIENALKQPPAADRRHRIEHASECPPELLDRLRKLPAVVVSQPPFLYYSGERYLATMTPEAARWLYRFRTFLDNGLVVAASSDSPLVPSDPLVGIYAAVTRRAENGQEVLPEEAVTVAQALAMYTASAAYASFEEKEKGTIAPGKLADMVVLNGDPTRLPLEEIRDIGVEMTIIGGEVVWER